MNSQLDFVKYFGSQKISVKKIRFDVHGPSCVEQCGGPRANSV